MTILQFPAVDALFMLQKSIVDITGSPVAEFLAYGKIAERPVITPGDSDIIVRPSAKNRYLEQVTVKAES